MEDKMFNWFGNSIFNQGEYAENKIKDIELMNMKEIQNTEESKELKL